MPRRAAPLDPDGGPLERFAAELRMLRAYKGAPTVGVIAATTETPRSTLYAVMAGKRVPSEKALVALVEACGGDAAEWLTKRSALLEELAGHAEEPAERPRPARSPVRTVLVCVRDQASVERTLAALASIETDPRIQILFTIDQRSSPGPQVHEYLNGLGALVLPWRQAVAEDFDLIVTAHVADHLKDLNGPLLVMAHGAGRWPDSPILTKRSALLALADDYQLTQLATTRPQLAAHAVVVGDPVYELLLASRGLRLRYRRALNVQSHQRLVLLSSTWGPTTLLGKHPDLALRLLAELPADEYKVAVLLPQEVWGAHGKYQVRAWLRDAVASGLRLLEQDDSWQSALIASDIVIGDHGSVTSYAAALGIPTVSAVSLPPRLDPKSRYVAPLDTEANLLGQLAAIMHDFGQVAHHQPQPEAVWRAGDVLRKKFYEMLGLVEPSAHSRPPVVEDPVHARMVQPASFRLVVREAPGADVRLERYPFVAGVGGERDFVVATDREGDVRVLDSAEVVVVTEQSPPLDAAALAEQLLTTYPGAQLTAAAAESFLVIRSRSSRTPRAVAVVVEASEGFTPDPALIVAATYLCLQQPNRSLRSRVRVGAHEFTVDLGSGGSS